MTIEELKALGYDHLMELTRIQTNIQLINARIEVLTKEQKPKDESTSN